MSLMLPSEALNRQFALASVPSEQESASPRDAEVLETHAVFVAGTALLLPPGTIGEITYESAVCRLPGTPRWFSGIANLRGSMLPVFDLAALFAEHTEFAQRPLLILGQGDESVGLWADRLPVWVTIPLKSQMDMRSRLHPLLAAHTLATYAHGGKCWVRWDLEALFTEVGERLRENAPGSP